jgi:molybdate transport system ATP-binding protein
VLDVAVRKQLGAFTLDAAIRQPTDGVIALFGRSGAGKTSLVQILAGLVTPDAGHVRIGEATLFDAARGIDLPPDKRRIGYVFQEGRLFPHYSVRGNLLYGYNRAPADGRRLGLADVVDLMGIGDLLHRRPRELSGGEKQRVALGRALLSNPRLLLMDEPLASLDQPRKDEILPFIERLRDELAIPLVYVSHAMDEIVRLADSMVLLSDGEVAASGSVEAITSRLDLRPLTGRYDAGAAWTVSVERQDATHGLTHLAFAGGELVVPRVDLPVGRRLRVRIRARDVALALSPPQDCSIINVLPSTVAEIGDDAGPLVDLRLTVGESALWARITRRSLHALGLAPGTPVHALIKAVAVDRHTLGRPAARSRVAADGEP